MPVVCVAWRSRRVCAHGGRLSGVFDRISRVYRGWTRGVVRGPGDGDFRVSVRYTLGPTPLGHRLVGNCPDWTGQGETWHILHQRCVGCDIEEKSHVAPATPLDCCFPLLPIMNTVPCGFCQATVLETNPIMSVRKSCNQGTFSYDCLKETIGLQNESHVRNNG